jgi:AraC-like DNA-binding protein/GNAT superfamily N-acetyltransferase
MEAETILKAKDFILSRLTSQFTLEDIANACGYSKYHFSREFRNAANLSVMEFVRKEKIADAQKQLLNCKSIFEIALAYGFDTHIGFTNTFSKYTGCTPSEFRKHAQKGRNYVKGEVAMDDAKTVIRLVKITDVNDMWENVLSGNTPEEIKQRIREDLERYENETGFRAVAEVNNVVVGMLACGRYNKYVSQANLNDFVIHPDYRGKGLARQLLNKVIEMLKDTPVNTLQIQSRVGDDDIKNKYISLGFTEVFQSGGLVYLMMGL